MPRASVAAPAGLALVAVLALAGCLVGCSDTSLLSSPATGDVVQGSTYRYHAPAGWGEVPSAERASGADTQIRDDRQGASFVDTMVVVPTTAGVLTPDQVESDGVAELQSGGLRDVTVQDRVIVGGTESAHLSGTRLTNAATYVVDQYFLTHDGQTWVVNFSFDAGESQTDRDDLAGSVLVTWQWT